MSCHPRFLDVQQNTTADILGDMMSLTSTHQSHLHRHRAHISLFSPCYCHFLVEPIVYFFVIYIWVQQRNLFLCHATAKFCFTRLAIMHLVNIVQVVPKLLMPGINLFIYIKTDVTLKYKSHWFTALRGRGMQ